MCLGSSSEKSPSATFYYPTRSSKRSKVQVHRLNSRRRITCCEEELGSVDMELMNLKLYLENQTIIEENKKLRKTASLLHKENLALFSELQKKFPNNNDLDR
ncbi:protein LITTLE ZIPPER 1-like isoform X1 [Humulus lupulus]|uniref:protein LITTLE ZIPPER 1-like isoform X1 n=1 Tax=Humulus lupulus TaxID=3486 RepID=UPI002B4036E2|nr:protein LITTLE ZIPPER 1-like isoform X1 [Humulus lupulus]